MKDIMRRTFTTTGGDTFDDVVREARAMIRFCEWANKQEQRDQDTSRS